MSIAERTHIINIYKHGKFYGYLSGKGGINGRRVHAARLTKEQAETVAAEITALNTEAGLTAKAVAPKKG